MPRRSSRATHPSPAAEVSPKHTGQRAHVSRAHLWNRAAMLAAAASRSDVSPAACPASASSAARGAPPAAHRAPSIACRASASSPAVARSSCHHPPTSTLSSLCRISFQTNANKMQDWIGPPAYVHEQNALTLIQGQAKCRGILSRSHGLWHPEERREDALQHVLKQELGLADVFSGARSGARAQHLARRAQLRAERLSLCTVRLARGLQLALQRLHARRQRHRALQ